MVVADIILHKLPHSINGSLRLTICITGHVALSERTLPTSSGVSLHGQEKWTYNGLILNGKMKCTMMELSRKLIGCTVQVLLPQWTQRTKYFSLYKSYINKSIFSPVTEYNSQQFLYQFRCSVLRQLEFEINGYEITKNSERRNIQILISKIQSGSYSYFAHKLLIST
jgi:hypothetical protein